MQSMISLFNITLFIYILFIIYILQIYIEDLKNENEELAKELETKVQQETHLPREVEKVNEDQLVTKNEQNYNDIITMQNSPLPEDKNISDNFRPITKLENRFKETMEKVAELTDEKQKLEHLVLQLQGETETIGKLYYFRLHKLCPTFFTPNFLDIIVLF